MIWQNEGTIKQKKKLKIAPPSASHALKESSDHQQKCKYSLSLRHSLHTSFNGEIKSSISPLHLLHIAVLQPWKLIAVFFGGRRVLAQRRRRRSSYRSERRRFTETMRFFRRKMDFRSVLSIVRFLLPVSQLRRDLPKEWTAGF